MAIYKIIVNFALASLFISFTVSCGFKQEVISREEVAEVSLLFTEMVNGQSDCHCCLDASFSANLSSLLFSGTVEGYLQSMSPGFVKMLGLGPIGQPVLILTSDGHSFRFVDVLAQKVYKGSVQSKSYKSYAPAGFQPNLLFYFLTGRLLPGDAQIAKVSRQDSAYLFELIYQDGNKDLLLFDAQQKVILSHVIIDEQGEQILDVEYGDYGSGVCPLPREIKISSLTLGSTLTITMSEFLDAVSLDSGDFDYKVPKSFTEVLVE